MSIRLIRGCSFSFVFAIVLAARAVAQTNSSTTANQLTGGSVRDWTLTAVGGFMGGNTCSSGEFWRFQTGGAASIFKCTNGKMKATPMRWSLRQLDALDTQLHIGIKTYLVVLDASHSRRTMVLTAPPGPSKIDPAAQLTFTNDGD